jgi:hypothetical protein
LTDVDAALEFGQAGGHNALVAASLNSDEEIADQASQAIAQCIASGWGFPLPYVNFHHTFIDY